MSTTLIERHQSNKRSKISIRPYFDPSRENMGLEKYGMTLFDGIMQEEELTCLEQHGVKRYVSGLNEFAPEVKLLPDEEKTAKVRQIRTVVADLEKSLASNIIEIEDKDFWNKVTLLRPDNHEFWSRIKIRVGNDPVYLEPFSDPYDLIKLYAIEAGGFSLVARSLDDARESMTTVKFYLDKEENTAAVVTEVKKLRNKALGELDKLFIKHLSKLFLVAKVVDPASMQYKKYMSNDVIYDNMDKYINGELVDKNKKKTAERFIEVANLDMESLKLRAIVKDATFLKVLHPKADGFIYHLATGQLIGKTPSDCVEFLKNPLNEELLKSLQNEVEQYWNL